jgi:hypothetical protein
MTLAAISRFALALAVLLGGMSGLTVTASAVDGQPPRTGGSGAATDLRAESRCRDRTPIVELTWTPAVDHGSTQRVDVATFQGGFEIGEFKSSAPLPPDQGSLIWHQVSPGALHFGRILTQHEGGWVSSEMTRFNGRYCVPDVPR